MMMELKMRKFEDWVVAEADGSTTCISPVEAKAIGPSWLFPLCGGLASDVHCP